ncbi:MAG: SUF system NifU family Fe-S cluster assembly protein [Ignavibacteria bacterium]|nr:SUF system NifU family Fe-S cluster assembly protein [Ignavibacteria bacterium]MCU7498005.1 SUF system NifU family Fe-S cluster assembly protein [Ignavibacteria bacterium]MCU7511708.1 SUF system NifU family Fe-S cluster assembly protein [Ignavibacteria bacterium]MCU7519782.1 SUF system NifU family Fe-S cluster assembly protein [Ignavibacteria bacterium]MCU7523720.1 SUF system NifU family Fe-S cluster assembly protein [Ignavibacteria bacterium]
MMSELSDLYQEVILDHNKSPRNYRKCETCNHDAEGFNPLCGDHIWVYIDLDGDKIKDISFQGSGCAISKSSASLMTSMLKGKTRQEAEDMFNKFHDVVTSRIGSEQDLSSLGKLAVFSGVRDYPSRVKCASLAWHTMMSALKEEKSASTE